MNRKTLIDGGSIITMDGSRRILERGSIGIDGTDIVDIGTPEEVRSRFRPDLTISAEGKWVLPGLINTHMHSQNALIRGTADDAAGPGWLNRHINPMHAAMTEEDAYSIARLSYLEALKTGTTSVVDMGRYMHRCADAAEELGIRAVMAPYGSDDPEYAYLESIEANEELVRTRHGSASGRVSVWFGIEFITYSSPDHYKRARVLADKYGVGINLHANARRAENDYARRMYGNSTIELLNEWRILGPDVLAAHCVDLSANEIEILAHTGTHVSYCPVAGMKCALGACPVPDLERAGVNVALGTDGAAENNSIDMIETLKFASLLQSLVRMDPLALPAARVLEMATLNGAAAMGSAATLGSLEPGKRADIVIVDPKRPSLIPAILGEAPNIIPQLVFSGHGDIVETVIVDGTVVIDSHRLVNGDEDDILASANEAAIGLLARRAEYVDGRDTSLDEVF